MKGLTDGEAAQGCAAVLHWYDFICPFCYLSQPDNAALIAAGLRVTELGFSAHPEIPAQGTYAGPRRGAMYLSIEETAARLGLPLSWPDRLPNTRRALGAAEWMRAEDPEAADAFRRAMFAAHFAEQRDIGDEGVVIEIARVCGAPIERLAAAISQGAADALLQQSQALGHLYGVRSTPAWTYQGRLAVGLQPGGLARSLLGVDA